MSFLQHLSITTKLFLGFGLSLAMGLLITLSGWFGLQQTQDSMQRLSVFGGMYDETVTARDANFQYALSREPAQVQAHDQAIGRIRTALQQIVNEAQGSGRWSGVDSAGIAQLASSLDSYRQAHATAVQSRQAETLVPQLHTLNARLSALQTDINRHYGKEEDQLAATLQRSQWQLLLTTLAALVCGLLMALLIARQIVQPLREALQLGQRIAAGDLTERPHSARRDELGQLSGVMGAVVDNLRQMIGKIRQSAGQVLQTSGDMVEGSSHLASRTEQQAAAIEETASTMEELVATVRNTSDHTEQAHQLASEVEQVVRRNGERMAEVTQGMQGITASSAQMAEIIQVIEGIAFQTNILALNAAVEAARAGEHGKGFAVVAGEVRALAQRSATAAREIKGLIDTSLAQIDAGNGRVEGANAAMQAMVSDVERIKSLLAEIAQASREQRDGIHQTNQVIVQIDLTTQQNATLVEESTAAAGTLQDQASRLAQAVAVFRLQEAEARRAVLGARVPMSLPG